ncbi:MAG: hypothetical protein ABJA50_11970, partial [Chloroflexota bacterium]
ALEPLARRLKVHLLVAVAVVGDGLQESFSTESGYTVHYLTPTSSRLATLLKTSDSIIASPSTLALPPLSDTPAPVATWGDTGTLPRAVHLQSAHDPALLTFCLAPQHRV